MREDRKYPEEGEPKLQFTVAEMADRTKYACTIHVYADAEKDGCTDHVRQWSPSVVQVGSFSRTTYAIAAHIAHSAKARNRAGLRFNTNSVVAMKVKIDPWFIANPRMKLSAPMTPKFANISKGKLVPDNALTAPILHAVNEEGRVGTMACVACYEMTNTPMRDVRSEVI
ncbi:hypothetical protein AS026_28085 [Rhizobium altiplani]|uniref:Uncharacterized protein n=1 Tax=Rhizobium altiplani TaxID=1864509 RepID=A0A120FR76_9HYPH|nr:hypothetical protein [Rhizobium altiplani]KWV59707.1 hypothetical protein AS026_28085 [Rhizobium altiplani]